MVDHDRSYKTLFSHPEVMRDLLAGFVREDWVAQIDYRSLEKIDPGYVGRGLTARANDIVWRVRWGDAFIYIYLMLEFQSTVDSCMAVRMLTYTGLLYEGLIRTKQLCEDGRLPPVLPIVLYNGSAPWRAERDLMAMMQPGPAALAPYRPQLRYLLIDEARYDDSVLSSMRNLAAAVFRLENSRTNEEMSLVLAALHDWLRTPEYENLQRDFRDWARRTILRKLPSSPADNVNDFVEMHNMLDNLEPEWKARWSREAQAKMMLRLMRHRFGQVPDEVTTRVEHASTEELDQWTGRLMSADSIGALLDTNAATS